MDMNNKAFHGAILPLMPYRENLDKDFIKRIRSAFKVLNDSVQDYPTAKTIEKELLDIEKKLEEIAQLALKGLHSKAFGKIDYLFRAREGTEPKLDLKKTLLNLDPKDGIVEFFRIRQMESTYRVSAEELFHIPLNNRGIVRTQRYSSPGYPCLYLGESIYGCWEEMHRPSLSQCLVSRFVAKKPINLVDLNVPDEAFLMNPDFIKLLPLIICCMMPVANDKDIFKPEYLIPQLVVEWVLLHRKNNGEMIHGITYTSTHKNDEFSFPDEKFINIAIPVFSLDSRKRFCKSLCEIFEISQPTTNDIEKLKRGYAIDCGSADLSEEELLKENYDTSDFGNLEKRLRSETLFPTHKLSYKS